MSAPVTVAVSTSSTELVATKSPGSRRSFIVIGRQDADTRPVLLSFGERKFTAANAAYWINAGERLTISPDSAMWSMLERGVFAKVATGADINVQVQVG